MNRDQLLEVIATIEGQLDVVTTELVKLPVSNGREALGAVNNKFTSIKSTLSVAKADLIVLELEGDEKKEEV